MRKRTKSLQIKPKTKEIVWERDNQCCILCGKYVDKFFANGHFIARSQGGLGIEQNIVTLCQKCHHAYDQTTDRPYLKEVIRKYLHKKYPNLDEKTLIYRK